MDEFTFPKPQGLKQRFDHDCGVVVFATLAGVSYEEVCNDLPDAPLGKVTVDGWIEWLKQRGFEILQRQGCPDDITPCAHLVALIDDKRLAHWVYRDAQGDIHDPAPTFSYFPADDPRMKTLSFFEIKVLTISVTRRQPIGHPPSSSSRRPL